MSTSIDDGIHKRQLGDWTDALDFVLRDANAIVEAFRGVDELGHVLIGAAEIGWRYDDDRVAVVEVVVFGRKLKDFVPTAFLVVILFTRIV